MTAVSSSLMQETSTTPQRSSEVSHTRPRPPEVWHQRRRWRPSVYAATLLERPCWMCYAVFLWWQPQYLQPVDFSQGRLLTMLTQCACMSARILAGAHSVQAAAENQLWCCSAVKMQLFKQEALRRLCGWTLAIISSKQEVELMTLRSQAQGFMSLAGGPGPHVWEIVFCIFTLTKWRTLFFLNLVLFYLIRLSSLVWLVSDMKTVHVAFERLSLFSSV